MSETMPARNEKPKRMYRPRVVGAIAASGALAGFSLGFGTAFATMDTTPKPVAVGGTIECSDGNPFVGATFKTADGKTGNVDFAAFKGSPADVNYHFDGDNTSYYMAVGCGGSAKSWNHTYFTEQITGDPRHAAAFLCGGGNPAQQPSCVDANQQPR
jgi:hypothetical protein